MVSDRVGDRWRVSGPTELDKRRALVTKVPDRAAHVESCKGQQDGSAAPRPEEHSLQSEAIYSIFLTPNHHTSRTLLGGVLIF